MNALGTQLASLYRPDTWAAPLSAIGLCLALSLILSRWSGPREKTPPFLNGPIVKNTYQYMTNMEGFLERIAAATKSSKVIQFRLGLKKIYMVSGEKNIHDINQPSNSISPDIFFLQVMGNVWGATSAELAKFAQDKSGRRKKPIPGYEPKPGQPRLWHDQHHVFSEYLLRAERANLLADKYYQIFSERLNKHPVGQWAEVGLAQFFEREMADAALEAFMGPHLVRLNPGFWDTMWEFAHLAPQLMWGLPKWMNRKPWQVRDRFHAMCRRWLDFAAGEWDRNGPDANADAEWEPCYGSRMARELIRWASSSLSIETAAGMVATIVFATNANSVPMCTWAMMEIIADPELHRAVRDECLAASNADPVTGARTFNAQKLLSMPLLQSLYVETLRLHISINITREVTQPITLDGYRLSAGSFIQAPSQIGHYDEVWSAPGHPATEFWAGRNLKHENGKTEFTMAGHSSSFLPYGSYASGGGPSICPGRVFAKQEILITLATLLTRFDIEIVAWVSPDGTKSDRRAQNSREYIGAVGIPPDRELKVRWKRLW
ncbi:cytochrome P450 [Aspergillus mulundensis]|uniref:Cytochrome P450 n=1 Tax=Aspergillus mulundensis TaxID=1810919 RepID=A0A3D8R4R6_9EURO|nr:Uncharacterized protein DSM5745_08681 [Aspergillus mulundensis]RDW68921.1 Uncharacterized protein DSM5745_08681 [Aspergillus mulundensis]